MNRLALASLCLAAAISQGAGAKEPPNGGYPWPTYSVVPILFSPTDWDINSAEVQAEAKALREAMTDIQRFYRKSLGGREFVLNELVVLQGEKAKEDYGMHWNGKNIYTEGITTTDKLEAAIVEELHRRGHPTPPAQNEDGYTVLIFVKGAGGWAGGRAYTNGDGGWAILGDWAIDGIQGTVPEGDYWWSGRRKQIGAAAHELGHAFGLPHPDVHGGEASSTVMGGWGDYPTVGLCQWDIDHLLKDKAQFFPEAAKP